MVRLIEIVAIYCLSFIFSFFATGALGVPTRPCEARPLNETYNITDSIQCDKYYECSEGNVTTKFCEHGFRFSDLYESCEVPNTVNCTGRDFNPRALLKPETCGREDGLFLCKYGKECVSAGQVCDGNFDCLDASDEFPNCEMSCNKTLCAHKCLPNPDLSINGSCFCDSGYSISLSNKSDCVDINECQIFGSCSHHCNNTKGSFQCSCMEGFKLGDNNRTCEAKDPKWKLIYATKSDVGMISRSTSGRERISQITHNDGRPVGITYDARNNLTYWTDASPYSEAIYRGTLDGKKIEVVADSGLLLPEGIAFDWITGNIYFADSNLSHIAVCRNDTNFCSVLIQERIDKPRDIALHPNEGIMFWTDWGNSPAIMRAGMDGSSPLAIVSTDLKWPNGIAVDQGNSRIYWVDANLDRIESSFFDGNDRQIVVAPRRRHPFGVDVFGDRIFWSDWSSHEIKSADKFTGLNSKVHVIDTYTLMNGVALFHVANQPIQRTNPCVNARCSHICTISPLRSFRCFCPVGMVLDDNDQRSCVEPDGLPKLVVAFKSTLKTMRFNSIGTEIFDSITLPQIKSISAVVYNPVNNTIIISDTGAKKIYEYSFTRKRLTVLIDQHLDSVKGMDIDPIGENLYWIDAGKQTVEVMSFRTRARTVLMHGAETLLDILVVPEIRSLFFARMGKRGGKIYKMQMTGYSISVIQRVGDKEPVALTYDNDFGNILWADKVYRSIESLSPDGQSNAVTVKHIGAPFDVVKYGNQIFWTDMFTQELKFLTFEGPNYIRHIRLGSFENNSSTSSNGTNFLGKMTVINRDISHLEEMRKTHECSYMNAKKKGCSHICLVSVGEVDGVCRCPEGLTLDQDGITCIKPSTCAQDQFTCSDGNCISTLYICDGIPDCSHNDDEVNCNQTNCAEGNFKCESNGVCVPGHWVCDGEQDCAEGEDEKNCTFIPCNEDFDFRCESTGRCIPKSWKCDHAFDCPGDDSDERGCNFTCPDGFFQCTTTQQCVMGEWVCDKEKDCDDGSDEMQNCADVTCPGDQFACNSGKCIGKHLICDGNPNCAESEDEQDCAPKGRTNRIEQSNVTIPFTPSESISDSDSSGSGTTVAIVFGTLIIIVLVAVIIALVLHKRNIQPKVLVRPYVQQWNKYIHEPARRMFSDGRGQQKLDCEKNVYDEVYAGGSATYYNTAVYEEVDGETEFETETSHEKRSQRDAAARSFADSGILASERESLYEEAEDCGSHYVSYNQKDKLLSN
ncbi:unnamed protein product [Orchesella dallaii]|uniref:Vitellogenin receptor n=1 Tax=Orchesella dallaii TaxID=48710 RepID=A0ABP1REN5_9HEXA